MSEEDVVIPSKEELLDIIDGDAPEQKEELQSSNEPQLSEVEQTAHDQGWTTKDEWVAAGKDAKDWRPADVWLDRGQFFQQIAELKRELNATRAQVSESFKTGQKIAENKFKEEIAELKAAKRQALANDDPTAAIAIQDKIEERLEEANKAVQQAPKQFTPPPEHNLFLQRNPWYEQNEVLRYTADGLANTFLRRNPKATAADLYFFVETQMHNQFPKLSGKAPAKDEPKLPASESGSGERGKVAPSKEGSLSKVKAQMNDMELSIMKTLVRNGDFKNEEEYLKEYSAANR
jgi:hypothetical protein